MEPARGPEDESIVHHRRVAMLDLKKLVPATGLLALAACPCAAVAGESPSRDWQMEMLFSPTPQQIEMEQRKSKVFIYSQVKQPELDRALDAQFGRIEHMMFINTLVQKPQPKTNATNPTAQSAWVEQDDGC